MGLMIEHVANTSYKMHCIKNSTLKDASNGIKMMFVFKNQFVLQQEKYQQGAFGTCSCVYNSLPK